MKNIRILSVILTLCLFLQVTVPGAATEPKASTDTTAATDISAQYADTVGDSSVVSGSHSVDAQNPLCGSSKYLKTAGAAILYEMNTDTLMYAWNVDTAMYPASLVKIMTALLALENSDPAAEITVSATAMAAMEGAVTTPKVQTGETVTLEHLLYCLLVGSENDAAVIIADHVAGSQQGFVAMMNRRATELGCTGTNFVNPHGLHDDTQVTTARDMTKIIREAVKHEKFMEYFSETVYTTPATNLSEPRELETTNYMMMPSKPEYYYKYVTGGRTGVNDKRERCLAVTAEKNGLKYIAVVLGAVPTFMEDGYTPIRFGSYEETKELLDLGFEDFRVTQVLGEGQILTQYAVSNGSNSVAAGPAYAVSTVLPSGINYTNLSIRYQQNLVTLDAPVTKGDQITVVQIWYGNVCVAQAPVIAMNSSEKFVPENAATGNTANNDGLTTVLLVILGVVGVVVGVAGVMYITQSIRKAAAKAQHRRRRINRRRSR